MNNNRQEEGNENSNGRVVNGNGACTPHQFGSDLATAAVAQMDYRAGQICITERLRLEAENQPKIAAAKQDLARVEQDLEKIGQEESKLPPEGDLRKRRSAALLLFAFALGLCIAGFASAVYGLEPLIPGLTRYFMALGLAVILPFGVHELINRWSHSERFMRWLAIVDCVVASVAMVSLAFIRSQVFAEQMSQATAPVIIDSDAPAVAPPRARSTSGWGAL